MLRVLIGIVPALLLAMGATGLSMLPWQWAKLAALWCADRMLWCVGLDQLRM